MEPRHFDEQQASEIFRRAAELEQRQRQLVVPREGMTLAELQEIGRQAGLDPRLVALAAAGEGEVTTRRFMGIPVGVGQVVELGREMGDAEWERFVTELRQTFDARGTVRVDGAHRQWSNGNLRVVVEPVATGHRVRFRTVNAGARAMMGVGSAFIAISAAVGLLDVVTAGHEVAVVVGRMGGMTAIGAAMFGWGAVQLPSWARRRREQMARLAEKVSGGGGGG